MANEFYALMGRMRYITRWGLMRNTVLPGLNASQEVEWIYIVPLVLSVTSSCTVPRSAPGTLGVTTAPESWPWMRITIVLVLVPS